MKQATLRAGKLNTVHVLDARYYDNCNVLLIYLINCFIVCAAAFETT